LVRAKETMIFPLVCVDNIVFGNGRWALCLIYWELTQQVPATPQRLIPKSLVA